MSLGIIFKGPEGIVLAVDSRVTLNAGLRQPNGEIISLHSTFDNATKLLRVEGQEYVGAITFGLGAIGAQEPRTAHSFIPEFEAILKQNGQERMLVEDFASALSEFFMTQWIEYGMPDPSQYQGDSMVFVVAGYDEGSAYGSVYQVVIPNVPTPVEQMSNEFGAIWGGQSEFVNRLLTGYDPRLPLIAKSVMKLDEETSSALEAQLRSELSISIPYQFLPLQDCVDLSIFLIRATINLQSWTIGIRGVGGAIDVATITKTEGFQTIQQKKISGERN